MADFTRGAALSLVAGGIAASALPAFAQSAAPVRMGALPIDALGEAYYGADGGIFASNGIDAKVDSLANGAAIMAAVIGGDLDVGMANTIQIATAIARGIPVQMIAPASLYSARDANQNLLVAKDSPVKSPKDLTGATFAVSALGDFNQLGLLAWLDANKVPRDREHFVELKFSEMGAALQRGTVQGAIVTEPFKSDAIRAGQARLFADTYSAVAPEFATIVWFSTKGWIQKNPELAKRLVTAIYAVGKWANAHPAETAPMLAKASKIDPALVARMQRVYFATENEKKYVEGPLMLAQRYNMLPRPVSVEEFTATL